MDGFNHHRGVEAGQDGGFVFAHQPACGVARGGAEDVGHDQYAAVVGKFLQGGDGVVDDVVLVFIGLNAENTDVFGKAVGEEMVGQPLVGFAYGFVRDDKQADHDVFLVLV